ncbi:MAG: DNA methyltransferase [Candidatus Omnitrophota bacterium]|jgi:DNA modification methylase
MNSEAYNQFLRGKPYYQDAHRTLFNRDCRSMPELSDDSIQCVVTSPPYWGLRKYAGQQDLIWGGKADCKHEWLNVPPRRARRASDIVNLKSKEATNKGNLGIELPHTNTCSLCGAWRGAYGLEPTPGLYIRHTVEILREIRRVLRPDGTVFWNIGDSYAGGKGQSGSRGAEYQNARHEAGESLNTHYQTLGGAKQTKPTDDRAALRSNNLKPKDLCLIPFRVAIAAQEDGWWVRSVIIWNKNNPMPESVTDRPTESHEYIILLTKSARYYWDAEAVREPIAPSTIGRGPVDFGGSKGRDYNPDKNDPNFRNGSEQWGRTYDYKECSANGRNLRSVWTFSTQPYKDAHFATFPEELPERCIKAATPEAGSCSKCGAPWVRIVEKGNLISIDGTKDTYRPTKITNDPAVKGRSDGWVPNHFIETKTLGWKPACNCQKKLNEQAIKETMKMGTGIIIPPELKPVPSLVLDPFAGSGTTLWVAARLGRKAVGYEIAEEYCKLIVNRNKQHILI